MIWRRGAPAPDGETYYQHSDGYMVSRARDRAGTWTYAAWGPPGSGSELELRMRADSRAHLLAIRPNLPAGVHPAPTMRAALGARYASAAQAQAACERHANPRN